MDPQNAKEKKIERLKKDEPELLPITVSPLINTAQHQNITFHLIFLIIALFSPVKTILTCLWVLKDTYLHKIRSLTHLNTPKFT